MPLSWNEIKSRALAFTQEWKDESNEHAEAKSLWNDFFDVFGISRRRVATFEHKVKKISLVGRCDGFIDLLWKGVILVEHKSRGRSLDKAYQQAKDYFPGLTEKELPRYILVSDFAKFKLYDLEEGTEHEFAIDKLTANVHLFGFIAGYQKRTYKEQDPVNIEAAELMGQLHDQLKEIGYTGHALELYLVRLVFLLFADDSNIWERGILYDYLDEKTNVDGSDFAAHIMQLFEVLNTAEPQRLKNLDESLAAFPYINGKLFEERLPAASFDSKMRKILIDASLLDWGKISPAIFGSLFQSVMDAKARRNLGAHYTSEKNILKLIKPLFLDELTAEFQTVKSSKAKLKIFHNKISGLRFLDPACGCGNFLIIAYRELRLLEIDIIKQRLKLEGYREEVTRDALMDISSLVQCDVDRFYGIEYEEFPAQIAQVAMWLIDHQMNQLVSNTFGNYYVRLPLRKSATIVHGNALRTDWQSLIEPIPWEKGEAKYDYILGNPPFIGHQWRNKEQAEDMEIVLSDIKRSGRLDYVTAWYIKAAKYMDIHNSTKPVYLGEDKRSGNFVKTAFVSTNSIAQGEQVAILWSTLVNKYKAKINFAHRTFKWSNEAKGNAGVHVVIIGFSNVEEIKKSLFEYDEFSGEPHKVEVKNINSYLTSGVDVFIESRGKPLHKYSPLFKGSQPTDGGFLTLSEVEKKQFEDDFNVNPKWIKLFLGADEFLYGKKRYCLWLKNALPSDLRKSKKIVERLELVTSSRLKSPTPSVKDFASKPTLFTQDRQPSTNYLAIPEVSSENRKYIPIAFLTPEIICSNKLQIIPDATFFMFGVLQSLTHMVWTKYVCGRLESRISYSPSVYNNFPWPENPTPKQTQNVEVAAQAVLDARTQFPEASLADLYDPNTMPPILVKAHQALDKAVDLCYRPQAFANETKRIEFLFELYDKYVGGLFAGEKGKKK